MNKFFTLAALAIVAAVVFVASPASGLGVTVSPLTGGTNNVAAAATNTYTATFKIPYNTRVLTLGAGAALQSAGNGGVSKWYLDKALDTTNYVPHTNLTLTMYGVTNVWTILDIDPGGCTQWRLRQVANTNAQALTNMVFKWDASRSGN